MFNATSVTLHDTCTLSDKGVQPGEGDVRPVILGLIPQGALLALYSLTTLLSVVGNIVVIVVFTAGRRQSKTDLTVFLISLAVADLLMATFCMPFTFTDTVLGNWTFGEHVCKLVLYVQTVSVTASVGTCMTIAIDRYLAVVRPFAIRAASSGHPPGVLSKRRPLRAIAIIWIASAILSIVQLYVAGVRSHTAGDQLPLRGRARLTGEKDPEGLDDIFPFSFSSSTSASSSASSRSAVSTCSEVWPPEGYWRKAYTFFLLLFAYILPLVVIALAYGRVCGRLWRHRLPGNADQARDDLQLKSKRKVIKMLITVVVLFGVCWLPLHLFAVVLDFSTLEAEGASDTILMRRLVAVYVAAHWLAMSNSFVNPIVYGFLNDGFRNELRYLFSRCSNCGREPDVTGTGGPCGSTCSRRRAGIEDDRATTPPEFESYPGSGVNRHETSLAGSKVIRFPTERNCNRDPVKSQHPHSPKNGVVRCIYGSAVVIGSEGNLTKPESARKLSGAISRYSGSRD